MKKNRVEIFHIAGTGPDRKDGRGSWFAFANPRPGLDSMVEEPGLSQQLAIYRAFVAVLEHMEPGSRAQILTESRLLPRHFARTYGVVDRPLCGVMRKARELVEDKGLEITVKWVPREKIMAAPYLQRNEDEDYSKI